MTLDEFIKGLQDFKKKTKGSGSMEVWYDTHTNDKIIEPLGTSIKLMEFDNSDPIVLLSNDVESTLTLPKPVEVIEKGEYVEIEKEGDVNV